MAYKLQLTKPANLRGSAHGSIDTLVKIYNWIINQPTGKINAENLKNELEKELRLFNCSFLSVANDEENPNA